MKNITQHKKNDVRLLNEKQWLYIQKRHHLTTRERQIAELVCRGLRNSDIAETLNITPGTIKTHIRNIYRKTRVNSKIEMLLKFVSKAKDISPIHLTAPAIPVIDVKKTAAKKHNFSNIPRKNE